MTEITRGDTRVARIALDDLTGEDPVPLNLAGKRITVTCRRGPDKPVLYANHIELDTGGNVVSATNMALETTAEAGVILETIPSDESAEFRPGAYRYDLEVREAVSGQPDLVVTPILGEPETVVADYTPPPS